jgi:integrase
LRDVRSWLNKLRDTCQCCAQGKDARLAEKQRRCCAKVPPICCRRPASERTIWDAWTILCSALTNAVTEELIPKNVASLAHVSKPRKRRVKPWTAEEARQFLESAKRDQDPLYPAYVLILVMGLRKGARRTRACASRHVGCLPIVGSRPYLCGRVSARSR